VGEAESPDHGTSIYLPGGAHSRTRSIRQEARANVDLHSFGLTEGNGR
jgi:hypothetical protein